MKPKILRELSLEQLLDIQGEHFADNFEAGKYDVRLGFQPDLVCLCVRLESLKCLSPLRMRLSTTCESSGRRPWWSMARGSRATAR